MIVSAYLGDMEHIRKMHINPLPYNGRFGRNILATKRATEVVIPGIFGGIATASCFVSQVYDGGMTWGRLLA